MKEGDIYLIRNTNQLFVILLPYLKDSGIIDEYLIEFYCDEAGKKHSNTRITVDDLHLLCDYIGDL
jgi:hypothetical protein